MHRENNIRRIDRPTSAIHGYAGTSASMTREPYVPFPLKNIANLRVDFLKRAAEDRFREDRKMEELSLKEFKIQEIELPTHSLPPFSQQELLVRGDYRGHGDPVEPAYPPLEHRQDGGTMKASTNAIQFLMTKEGFVSYFYYDKDPNNPKKRYSREEVKHLKDTDDSKYRRITIGYGFTLKWHPELNIYFDKDMTQTEAEQIILNKLHNEYEKQVNSETKGILLTQNQFDALCSVMYNMGLGSFKDAKIKEALQTGNMEYAAEIIYQTYNRVGDPIERESIRNRREKEKELFLKP